MNDVKSKLPALIYKICGAKEWHNASAQGRFDGSADDRRDGFIHFSTRSQLGATADKHFKDRQGLVLVAVDGAALGEALKWEASRCGASFPHLYGSLDTNTALWVRPLPLGPDGHHIFPEEMS